MSDPGPRFRSPARGWGLTRFDGCPFPEPDAPGTGALDLRVGYCRFGEDGRLVRRARQTDRRRTGELMATLNRLRTSLVPVVVVDGEPVASGWGRTKLRLREGTHLVEVQSLHSRAHHMVRVEPGRTVKLDYVGVLGQAHRRDRAAPQPGPYDGCALGPRGRLHLRQLGLAHARDRRENAALIAVMAAVAVAAAFAYRDFADEDQRLWVVPIATAVAALLLAVGGATALWKHLRSNRTPPFPPTEYRPYRGTAAPVTVVDAHGASPEPSPGTGAVLIDARFAKDDLELEALARQLPEGVRGLAAPHDRHLADTGEAVPIRHRFAVPPPRIAIDGRHVAAAWTRMWIELPVGDHVVEAATPSSPMPVVGPEAPAESRRIAFRVEPGRTTALALRVDVYAVPDPTERYLHGWRCSFGEATVSEAG
ncbi:hypothetical protein L0U85_00640 [Glycomyces sp. L485]|uniref:hypothetical protein n=1 Tax=Glycomyces sp. L485 TaxID=2909235 RepID=UPI001F4B1202|nr:hypothetical protein [Glycomyces sp. L485]MCH7229376.1 hypothetical protein [Glycomyces sp. L485]